MQYEPEALTPFGRMPRVGILLLLTGLVRTKPAFNSKSTSYELDCNILQLTTASLPGHPLGPTWSLMSLEPNCT